MRHFALPIYAFTHPKYNETQKFALVNRKRLMPNKLAKFEGMVGLFGGAAEPGEDAETALRRELLEELGMLLPAHIVTEQYEGFTVSTFYLEEALDQELLKELSGRCNEGVVDILNDATLPHERYVFPALEGIIRKALNQR